jgi:PAS domain S-box-containing protein
MVINTLAPECKDDFLKDIEDTLKNDSPFDREYCLFRPDGTSRYTHTRGEVTRDKEGNPVRMFGIVQDITDRKGAEEKLRLFRNLIDQSIDAIFVSDPKTGRILDANDRACVNLGYKREELLNMRVFDFEANLPDQFSYREHVKEVQNRGYVLFEGRHRRQNGTTFPVEVNVSSTVLGKISYLVAVVRDVTERKQAEEQIRQSLKEKEILLREIHHRVKNNLQIVSSLLAHQAEYIQDKNVIDMFTESQNRILSMSLVHEKLYQSKDLAKIDFNEYINDMVAELIQSYEFNAGKITLNMNIENIPLDIGFAIPCGLIINELVTNSLKYAFPAGTQGEIRITLRSTDENMLELMVSDNGIGIPEDLDFRKTESLGLHLITTLAENQLHGEISLDRSKGTEFQIKFRGIK